MSVANCGENDSYLELPEIAMTLYPTSQNTTNTVGVVADSGNNLLEANCVYNISFTFQTSAVNSPDYIEILTGYLQSSPDKSIYTTISAQSYPVNATNPYNLTSVDDIASYFNFQYLFTCVQPVYVEFVVVASTQSVEDWNLIPLSTNIIKVGSF